MFYGNADFRKVLGRDHFLKIRAFLQLYRLYRHEEAVRDPFSHSSAVCDHSLKHCAEVSVPVGVSARTKIK